MFRDFIELITGQTARKKRNRKIALGTILGVLGGTALGGALGILFAPQSGEETRKDIQDATEKGVKKTKEVAKKGVEKTKEAANEIGSKVSDKADEVSSKFKKAGNKLSSKVSDTYNEFKDNVEDVKDQRVIDRFSRRNKRLRHESENPVAGQTVVTPNYED